MYIAYIAGLYYVKRRSNIYFYLWLGPEILACRVLSTAYNDQDALALFACHGWPKVLVLAKHTQKETDSYVYQSIIDRYKNLRTITYKSLLIPLTM